MSLHYKVDLFEPVILNAKILGVESTATGTSTMAGNFVVRVPDGLSVQNPVDCSDLLTKKNAAQLAFYAGFTQIVSDDLLDTTGIDILAVGSSGMFGSRGNILVNPSSLMQSLTVGLGSNPAQCLVTWETFVVTTTDPAAGQCSRVYQEIPSDGSNTTCEVSFDNGLSWLWAVDRQVLNIPLLNQGPNFKIRIHNVNATPMPLNIGSWSMCF